MWNLFEKILQGIKNYFTGIGTAFLNADWENFFTPLIVILIILAVLFISMAVDIGINRFVMIFLGVFSLFISILLIGSIPYKLQIKNYTNYILLLFSLLTTLNIALYFAPYFHQSTLSTSYYLVLGTFFSETIGLDEDTNSFLWSSIIFIGGGFALWGILSLIHYCWINISFLLLGITTAIIFLTILIISCIEFVRFLIAL